MTISTQVTGLSVGHGSGSRKEARARVWLQPGSGRITINGKALDGYFPTEALRQTVRRPLTVTNLESRYDVTVMVEGGGVHGQAGATRHGLARALLETDETLRRALRGDGLLTRDPRMKERKKYGRKRARKGFQYSKR